jgi:hypothetical protein
MPTITRSDRHGCVRRRDARWRVDSRCSCSVDGLRHGTRRHPVGVRYRCTPGRHRYSEDEANLCGVLAAVVDCQTLTRDSPKSSILLHRIVGACLCGWTRRAPTRRVHHHRPGEGRPPALAGWRLLGVTFAWHQRLSRWSGIVGLMAVLAGLKSGRAFGSFAIRLAVRQELCHSLEMFRPHEARSCRATCVSPLLAHWATSHEPLVGSWRCPSRLGPHPGARIRSRRPMNPW